MNISEGGGTRVTGTGESGGSGESSAAAEAERAAREAQRAAEEAARAAAEAARAQASQAAQAQARAEAAAKRAQEALKKAQEALKKAEKQNVPKNELTRVQQAVAKATTASKQATTSARTAGSRASNASSFVPAKPTTTKPTTTTRAPAGPPALAPGVTPGYTEAQAAKDATELYRATKGGLTGWGTDKDAIYRTLEKRTPADIALIRKSFQEHYKLDLDATLRDELSGAALTRVNGMLGGNKGTSGAAAIQEEMGLFGDEDAILKTLQQATPAERQAIARSFQKTNEKGYPGIKGATPEEFLRRVLEPKLDGAQKTQLRSLLATTQATAPAQVNQLEANAARTQVQDSLRGFFGADAQEVYDAIKDLPADQKKLLLADPALQAEMKKELSKEEYNQARALLESNPTAASAAKIESAMQGWLGADESAILDILKNTKPEDMPALKAEFEKQTQRSLESEIRSWGGNDAAVGLRYLNPPAANDTLGQAQADAERLHRAMDGGGTDEAALREILGSKSKAQLNDIFAAYSKLYDGRSLRSDLVSELSGRDKFEIVDQMYDLGAVDMRAPDAAQQQAARLRAQQKFEQSAGLGLVNLIQTATKGESDSARLERNLDATEAAISTGDTSTANRLVGYSTDDIQDVQESKDSAADMASTAAVVVATTAAVVATGGAATPLALAGYATLGATTRVATQMYFKGDSLGTDGMMQQGVLGAVEGATAVIPVPKVLGGGATAAVSGAEQVVKQTAMQRLRGAAIQGAWEGGVGGAISGAADQSMQSETWQNGLMPGLSQVGNRALRDAAIGTVFGAGTGAGVDGVMQGASRLTAPRDIPVVRNPDLEGSSVQVRYGDSGRVHIEAGPKATPAQIQAHLETAKTLQKYEGPLGQARQLRDRAMQALTEKPGYGTQGFESQLEVKKLKGLITELEGVQQKLDTRLHSLDNGAPAPTAAQRADMERELESLRKQLAVHEQQVGSLAPARGFVASMDSMDLPTELAQRLGAQQSGAVNAIVKQLDFTGDSSAISKVETAWRDTYTATYKAAREGGKDAKQAGKAASYAAGAKAKDVATDLATQAAKARADSVVGDPNQWNLSADELRALAEFSRGVRGTEAKRISPLVDGLKDTQLRAFMQAEVAAGRATRMPNTTLPNGKPQEGILYPDGTLLRFKPNGDGFVPDPSYSVEVLIPGVTTPVDQDDIAFKMTRAGTPAPKGPASVTNPYNNGTNPTQYKAFEKRIVESGHLRTTP
jgi:type III secretion translocon protein HrpF